MASRRVCNPMVDNLSSGNFTYSYECENEQWDIKFKIRKERQNAIKEQFDNVCARSPSSTLRPITLACEKGASNWLTELPLQEFGFVLHKSAFRDALSLRYGWCPQDVPTQCACGKSFSVEHCLSFPIIRHNEIRNLTADLLTETCHDVQVEPHLQPISRESFNHIQNTADGARLDIAVNGFWVGQFERTYLDVRVFNPFAASYKHVDIGKCYQRHEREKKNNYERRILEIEHGSFTPLVFTTTGGMARECTMFYKRLASLLSFKRDQSYSETLCWLRTCISFALLRSSIQCIRGARSSLHHANFNISYPSDCINNECDITNCI